MTGKPTDADKVDIDAIIADARACLPGSWIEIPISLWSPADIEELYRRLPPDLRIDPEGRLGARVMPR